MSYTKAEVVEIIRDVGKAYAEKVEEYEKNQQAMKRQLDGLETAVAQSQFPGGGGGKKKPLDPGKFAVTVDGKTIPVLAKGERMADLFPAPAQGAWSIGDFVRASMGMQIRGEVLERGSSTVPSYISSQIIDAVREKARIMQAGAITIPIEGKTTIARIDGDPTVYEHVEAANDIQESIPVFSPVELNPRTLAALIPLSLEIVQDSPNLDAALQASISAAFALKLDQLGIAKILADTNIPTSSEAEATNDWAGVLKAVGSMLGADQEIPKAMICSPGDFIDRASQVASTSGVWLGAPPALKDMLDLETTGMSDGTAILGDFSKGFGIAVRHELRLELVRWGKPTYGSHILVAYARMAGYVLQPNHLYIAQSTVDD